ncbi:hypothetical protein Bhz51_00226 [Stenotrophomonas phage vB_SmaM_Bhz51]
MMPKYFDHNSPSAPLLTGGINNNLIQVLKFALIPSGWTLVWEDVGLARPVSAMIRTRELAATIW